MQTEIKKYRERLGMDDAEGEKHDNSEDLMTKDLRAEITELQQQNEKLQVLITADDPKGSFVNKEKP